MGDSNHDTDETGRSRAPAKRDGARDGAARDASDTATLDDFEPRDGDDEAGPEEGDADEPAEAGPGGDGPASNGARRRRRRRGGREGEGASVVPADERSAQALRFTTELIRKMLMDCTVRLQPPSEDSGDINLQI